MSELMDIGKRIATIRKQRGKTQAWIAARLYISRQTVSLWEQGKAKPSVDLLPALCELLDVLLRESRKDGLGLVLGNDEAREPIKIRQGYRLVLTPI